MLSKHLEAFIRDEDGSYTIWSLTWFILYVAIGGLAVDGTDAYRNQTLLQSTADAAALAGVMSLYEPGEDPVDMATAYAAANMDPSVHGSVLADTDVLTGVWDFDTETFFVTPYDANDPNETVNAVYVVTRRSEDNGNPVIMSFLRILQGFGLKPWWNINTEAVAARFIPKCLQTNALVANNKVDVTSNNEFKNICIHAQNAVVDNGKDYAIDMNNGNIIGPGTQFSMPDTEDMNNRPNVYTMNDGLDEEGVVVQGTMPPFSALDAQKTIADFDNAVEGFEDSVNVASLNDGGALPGFMFDVDIVTVEDVDETYTGPYEPNTIYNVNCSSENKQLTLPGGVEIRNVAIIADCSVGGASGVQLKDAFIASSADGPGPDGQLQQNSISFPSDAQLGDVNTFCESGGGQVHLYSAASMKVAAGPTVMGLRMVAYWDIQFSANNDVFGVSAEAGNNITATANGSWEYCPNEIEGPFAFSYRLVR